MIASTITVTTSPTVLMAATANATRIIFEPVGTDIHIGGSAVTTTTGLVTKKDVISSISLPPKNALYGVTSTGTVDIRVLLPEGDY